MSGLSHMALALELTLECGRCGTGGMAGVSACDPALRPPYGRVRRLLRRGCGPTAGQCPPRPARVADNRALHFAIWRRGLLGHGAVRGDQSAVPAPISEPASWH